MNTTILADGAHAFGSATFLLLFVAYWIPAVVAAVRGVPNRGSVIVINLFLGWTVIGWIIALAMAFGNNAARR